MTKRQWLKCENPQAMLALARGRERNRKFRLVTACACRRIWDLLPPACWAATDALELYADGAITPVEYGIAWGRAGGEANAASRGSPNTLTYAIASVGISNPPTVASVATTLDTAATAAACAAAENVAPSECDAVFEATRVQEVREQLRLVRDIVGHRFQPVTFDPAWRTDTALSLARHMSESRDFSAMPILADALQDAGCDNDDILNHCRGEGPHVRGCWVADLVLGKE